jgi:hypothetical protein
MINRIKDYLNRRNNKKLLNEINSSEHCKVKYFDNMFQLNIKSKSYTIHLSIEHEYLKELLEDYMRSNNLKVIYGKGPLCISKK